MEGSEWLCEQIKKPQTFKKWTGNKNNQFKLTALVNRPFPRESFLSWSI